MKLFEIIATIKMGAAHRQPFSMKISADNRDRAVEMFYTLAGSKHSCPRRFIKVQGAKEVQELKPGAISEDIQKI